MPRPCTVKDRPLEARAPKEGSIELCRSEDRSPQVRPAKNSLAQIGAIQVRSRLTESRSQASLRQLSDKRALVRSAKGSLAPERSRSRRSACASFAPSSRSEEH